MFILEKNSSLKESVPERESELLVLLFGHVDHQPEIIFIDFFKIKVRLCPDFKILSTSTFNLNLTNQIVLNKLHLTAGSRMSAISSASLISCQMPSRVDTCRVRLCIT